MSIAPSEVMGGAGIAGDQMAEAKVNAEDELPLQSRKEGSMSGSIQPVLDRGTRQVSRNKEADMRPANLPSALTIVTRFHLQTV